MKNAWHHQYFRKRRSERQWREGMGGGRGEGTGGRGWGWGSGEDNTTCWKPGFSEARLSETGNYSLFRETVAFNSEVSSKLPK